MARSRTTASGGDPSSTRLACGESHRGGARPAPHTGPTLIRHGRSSYLNRWILVWAGLVAVADIFVRWLGIGSGYYASKELHWSETEAGIEIL